MVKKDSYCVWDGIVMRRYSDSPKWHDCIITIDDGLISVQDIRRKMIAANVIPTVIFACKSGQKAMEQGKLGGVFSSCWNDILGKNPSVTFRDAIRLTNLSLKKKGIAQRAEIICRRDILNMAVMKSSIPNAAHAVMTFDMCRRVETGKGCN